MAFIQWIPTKHIPIFRIVRILIFVIVFWRWKWPISRFFKFQTLITRKLSILKKNHKSTYCLEWPRKPTKICFKWKKWKICNLFKQFFLNNGDIIFFNGPNLLLIEIKHACKKNLMNVPQTLPFLYLPKIILK